MESNRILDNLAAIKERVKRICDEYGLYGTAVLYPECNFEGIERNRLYIVAGTTPEYGEDPPGKNIIPKEIVQRIGRNEQLFYPGAWAVDITDGHDMTVYEDLVDYCKQAEFLSVIYSDHGLSMPEKIRFSEVEQLQTYDSASSDLSNPFEVREKCQKDLKWFFRRERSHGFRRKWLDYFRSDKFPDDKGPVARILGYLRRNKPEIPLKQLLEINGDIDKLEMQEFEYKLFAEFMQQCYPEVSYSVGNKEIINHGVDRPGHPPLMGVRRITSEEFAVIRKERFAEEGWECLMDVKPSYWEFRNVYFKDIDEPQIAAAYQAVTLQYAQPNDLYELQRHGELALTKFPVTDFMNFVSLAKTNGFRFYIDKLGQFEKPSLDSVTVIFNKKQEELLEDIKARMVSDKITGSHLVDFENRIPLETRISNAQHLPEQEGRPRRSIMNEPEL